MGGFGSTWGDNFYMAAELCFLYISCEDLVNVPSRPAAAP